MKRFVWISFALALVAAPLRFSMQVVPKSELFDSSRLLEDLKTLASDAMEGRQAGTPGGEKARNYIISRFKESGVVPFGQAYEAPFAFSARDRAETRGVNVVGHIDGARTPRRYIVVSAHYDHLGVRNGTVFNGADDNASGTAALFSIAEYFATHRPQNSLIFVAFDAEESGLRGSQAFVRRPPVERSQLAINLNVDMIGREPDNRLFVVGTALQPFLKPMITALSATVPVKLLGGHEDPAQPEDWTHASDHYSFIQGKIPALYFGVEDFAQHHKPTDDYETMSHGFYVRAVETLVKVVQYFDQHLEELDRRGDAAAGLATAARHARAATSE